jgi:hypothetical protein
MDMVVCRAERELTMGSVETFYAARRPVRLTSKSEAIGSHSAMTPQSRFNALGLLVASASSTACGGHNTLRPLWANEALHRASNFIRLMEKLEANAPPTAEPISKSDAENGLVLLLAAGFGSLYINDDTEPRLCSEQIADINRTLIELFGPAVGDVIFESQVDHLVLPAYAHRALILLAVERVTNCLLHGFRKQQTGRITLDLRVLSLATASLTITDNGEALCDRHSHDMRFRSRVSDDLADLLQTKLTCSRDAAGGTIATITFPYSDI